MEFNIPKIAEIKEIIQAMKTEILKKDECAEIGLPSQEWFSDEQCWAAKGGMVLSTYRSNRFYQCKGGIPDGYVGGRKVWSRESVSEWILLTDDKLAEYHEKYKTGAKRK